VKLKITPDLTVMITMYVVLNNDDNYDDNVITKPVRNAVQHDISSYSYACAYLVSWHGPINLRPVCL
jgi:hypothetical protein